MPIDLPPYTQITVPTGGEDVKIELAWVDFETTGLETDPRSIPLEVGCILTDRDGNEAASYRSLIYGFGWYEALREADDIVREMHSANGLTNTMVETARMLKDPIRAEKILGYPQVDQDMLDFLVGFAGAPKVLPMAGSTINFDRYFMKFLPMARDWFHYRNADVSSIKNFCRIFNPGLYAQLPQLPADQKAHRPLEDLRESIKELLFYRDNFFFVED